MTKQRFFYLVPAGSRYPLAGETITGYLRRMAFNRTRRLPTGGVKVIYQHCDMLMEAGFEAYPVHLGNMTIDWFEHNCKPVSKREAERTITQDDILVVPERIPAAAALFPCRSKLAFVQNGGLVAKAVAGGRYEDFGFTGILCCSAYLSDFMESRTCLPRMVVTNGIALDLFVPAPERRRNNTVLYLKRKSTWRMGRDAISRLPGDVRQKIQIIELPNGCSEKEMVRQYQAADIFMALGYPEGFALPPLEAMACGCAVIGFSGGGGLTHMQDGHTALVVPDGDVSGLTQALSRIIRDTALKENIRREGFARSKEFDIPVMQKDILAFARTIA